MDRHQFDQLARTLATPGTRRGLLGAAFAAMAGLSQASDGAAARKKGARKDKQRARKQRRKRKTNRNSNTTSNTNSSNTPDDGRTSQRLTFCQNGQTITAPSDQSEALLAAGATPGACPDPDGACLDSGAACAATSECCGDLVCAYIEHGVGVCRVNHAPVAHAISVRNPWRSPCVPITLTGYEPDRDFVRFRIVTTPTEGFLSDLSLENTGAAGWTTGLPAPPLPDGADMTCPPRRCRTASCDTAPTGTCSDCSVGVEIGDRALWFRDQDGELVPTAGAFYTCPEGWYFASSFCYIPYKSTFKGSDAFTYSMVDEHGAEGPAVSVDIDVYET
ncbi:MAG: hypothetical protein QM692_19640 [Thermomicrobiales bacterium]